MRVRPHKHQHRTANGGGTAVPLSRGGGKHRWPSPAGVNLCRGQDLGLAGASNVLTDAPVSFTHSIAGGLLPRHSAGTDLHYARRRAVILPRQLVAQFVPADRRRDASNSVRLFRSHLHFHTPQGSLPGCSCRRPSHRFSAFRDRVFDDANQSREASHCAGKTPQGLGNV